jgi:hypothetical protein
MPALVSDITNGSVLFLMLSLQDQEHFCYAHVFSLLLLTAGKRQSLITEN